VREGAGGARDPAFDPVDEDGGVGFGDGDIEPVDDEAVALQFLCKRSREVHS
jgi:hypothetical protein